jgi:pimeloyl-ACP methyl ester carboxylesterase
MALVTPLGLMSRGSYADPSFTANPSAHYTGRRTRSNLRTVTVYVPGPGVTPSSSQAPAFQETFNALADNDLPVIVPRLGATDRWATSAVVGAGGLIDQAIAWAATPLSLGAMATLPNKVNLVAHLNGALNAIVWAWQHPGMIRSIVLLAPIVDPGAFYTANPSFQASIDADWGSHGAFLAALPNINPMAAANQALVRPFADRILCVYAASGTQVDPNAVIAWANLVGANLLEVPGGDSVVVNSQAEAVAAFVQRTVVKRPSVDIRWEDNDWDLFTERPLTLPGPPPNNVRDLRTSVFPDGRRGQVTRVSGSGGNERWSYTVTGFSAPDVGVRTTWYNGDGDTVGQPGNIMRGRFTATTYLLYVCWANIFFSIGWIINRGIWSGTLGANDLVLTQTENTTIPGIRLNAGGQVLASSRTANVVTLVIDPASAPKFKSGTIDVVMAGPIGNFSGNAVLVDDQHIVYTLAGADVASGGPGSWADIFGAYPYDIETTLVGDVMRGRTRIAGMDWPSWTDPNWTFVWTDAHGGPTFQGYGEAGVMGNHIGIFKPPSPPEQQMQYGRTVVYEV